MSLRAEGLKKRYGSRLVVDGVSVEVNAGEIVGLLGPNGAGKTTSFYMIVGLVRPDAGSITLDGTDVSPLPMFRRARQGLGDLCQEPSIFRRLSVRDNLDAILEHLPLSPEERRRKRDTLLEDLAGALAGPQEAQQRLEEGGLAGAVGAQQAHHAVLHVEGQALQGHGLPVSDFQLLE